MNKRRRWKAKRRRLEAFVADRWEHGDFHESTLMVRKYRKLFGIPRRDI